MVHTTANHLIALAQELAEACDRLSFAQPVACVYNPLRYAQAAWATYCRRYATGPRPVLFLGMNPGPFGMVQTGIPFGDPGQVREFLHIDTGVEPPARQHPRRPVQGFACRRGEVSGRRLWSALALRFGSAEALFQQHFVVNWCPLAFLDDGGRNLTPDKLPLAERSTLEALCDRHLARQTEVLATHTVVGIGTFAAARARKALAGTTIRVVDVPHPSPASPLANRGWEPLFRAALAKAGL